MINVIIIHPSAIFQVGLGDIIRKRFKCSVDTHSEVHELNSVLTDHTILLVSEELVDQLKFADTSRVFRITNIASKDKCAISILDDEAAICEKLAPAFDSFEQASETSEGLSTREIDVLKLVALGHANKDIAEKLFISTHTVMSHRKNITEKLGIKSISGLTVYAILNDYIDTTNLNVSDLI